MPTFTIINMGSGKSWQETPNQIWTQLFWGVAAQQMPGCRIRLDWQLGLANKPRARGPANYNRMDGFSGGTAWQPGGPGEAIVPRANPGDVVQLNDGPTASGYSSTKIRNAVRTLIPRMVDGDTVNIVGHSRGGWLAWPQAELIAASNKNVTINMFLIDPVRRAWTKNYRGDDVWLKQYAASEMSGSIGVNAGGDKTQKEKVSQKLLERLGYIKIMYMSNTNKSFPKMSLEFPVDAANNTRFHFFTMPGKHGSATNSDANPYLTNLALWMFQKFLHENGTVQSREVRIRNTEQLTLAWAKVRSEHRVSGSTVEVTDSSQIRGRVRRETVPSVVSERLKDALLVEEQLAVALTAIRG